MEAEISEVLTHLRSVSGNVPLHRRESNASILFHPGRSQSNWLYGITSGGLKRAAGMGSFLYQTP